MSSTISGPPSSRPPKESEGTKPEATDTSTRQSVLQRVGGEVETVGVEAVPNSQRTSTPGKLTLDWAMASGSATTPLIGLLLYPYGLWYMIAAIVIAWAVFLIPTGMFSEIGRKLPLTSLVVSRRTYGWGATLLLSALFTFVNVAWFGLNTAVGAQILAALSHTSEGMWYWIVGGLDVVLVLFGFKWLEYFYRYTAVLLIVCYAALAVYLFAHYSVHMPEQTAPMSWGTAISTVAGFSIIGWMYNVTTLSRFAKPAKQGERSKGFLLAPGNGIMIPVLLMGVLGAFSQRMTGSWNIALLGVHISGWGAVAAIGAALGVLHCNALNLYPSTVSLLVTVNNAGHKARRWDQPVATVVLGVVGIVLAKAGILAHAETFVNDMGDLVGPFAFVMLVDWLWGLKRRDRAAGYFERPRAWLADWRIPAVVCCVVGFVVSFWGQDFLSASLANDIPFVAVGSFLSAVLYGLWLWLSGAAAATRRDRAVEEAAL
jgi:purine-cytosine permease-like protein